MSYQYETNYVIYNTSLVKYRQDQHQPPHSSCFCLHWHERMELIRITSGEMVVNFGNEQTTAKAGEVVIVSPNQPHEAYTKNEGVEYFAVMFDIRNFYNQTPASKNQLEAIFNGRTTFKRKTSDSSLVSKIDSISINFQQSIADNDLKDLFVCQVIYSLIYELYSSCLSDFSHQKCIDEKILKAIEYMEKHFDSEINFASLGKQLGYNTSYFSQKFKENTGITPMAFLKIIRLKKASSLLKTSNYTVSEVALMCGFSDPNYFTRCFKRYYNYTPTFVLKRKDLQIADRS